MNSGGKRSRARRKDLSQLRERRAELLEGGPEAPRLAVAAFGAVAVRAIEQLAHAVLGEHRRDRRAARHRSGVRAVRFILDGFDERRRLALRLPGVDDDHGAAGVVADAIGHVAEQELPAAGHAGVADDENIGRILPCRSNDGHRGVVVEHDAAAGFVPADGFGVRREIPRQRRQIAPVAGGTTIGPRHDHLHDVQFCVEPLGETCRPANGLLGRLGAIGSHHDATRDAGQRHVHSILEIRGEGTIRRRRCHAPSRGGRRDK